jgi:hypothetical protein
MEISSMNQIHYDSMKKKTGDIKNVEERLENGVVRGSYSLLEADGKFGFRVGEVLNFEVIIANSISHLWLLFELQIKILNTFSAVWKILDSKNKAESIIFFINKLIQARLCDE